MRIILASSSPRRKELLELLGLSPEVIVPITNEEITSGELIENFLKRVTEAKGRSVYQENFYNDLLVSADTVVILGNRIIGKPQDRNDAFDILKSLSANKHEVWTGLAIFHKGNTTYDFTCTNVYFENLSEREINYYLDNENYEDKAGAYAIQGLASVFVRRIEGCFFNVMGFPLNLFFKMLKRNGIEIYD